jgi:hypothetical protein
LALGLRRRRRNCMKNSYQSQNCQPSKRAA